MKFNNILNHYKQLNNMIEQMLKTVINDEWDKLPSMQAEYEQISQKLRKLADITDQLTAQEQAEIGIQITQILSNQQQLKQLIISHRAKIGKLIGETVNQRSQINNYHQVATLR